MRLPNDSKKLVQAHLKPFLDRYAHKVYRHSVEKFVTSFISADLVLSDDILKGDEQFIIKQSHTVVYDNRDTIEKIYDKILQDKQPGFINGFFNEFTRLLNAYYIQLLNDDTQGNYIKIFLGNLFLKVIETMSQIEKVNIDDYLKICDYMKTNTAILEEDNRQVMQRILDKINSPETTVSKTISNPNINTNEPCYYWEYSPEYLSQLEQYLLKGTPPFIKPNPNFKNSFKVFDVELSYKTKWLREQTQAMYLVYRALGKKPFGKNNELIPEITDKLFSFETAATLTNLKKSYSRMRKKLDKIGYRDAKHRYLDNFFDKIKKI